MLGPLGAQVRQYGLMEFGGASRALFARAQLAFTAAAAVMAGRFEAFTSDGMLVLATDVTGLEFLNSVVEVNELSADALPALLAVFAGLGAPMPALSLATDAEVGLGRRLRELSYQPSAGRPVAVLNLLQPQRRPRGRPVSGHGLTVTEVMEDGPISQTDAQTFRTVLASGYGGAPALTRFLAAEHAAPGVRRFLCRRQGEPIAVAAMSMHGVVAVLGGAATLPAARGRGAQRALLQHRLREAERAGCSAATASTVSMSHSHNNLAATGFTIWQRPTWRFAPATTAPDLFAEVNR